MSQLYPVSFHGDTIYCINHNNEPYTAMRPIVENMGLDWGAQQVKLNSSSRWSVGIIPTVAQDGKERQALCMPVRKLPAFLASINPRKVKPELRERIELYQAECDDALWQYWTEGQATRAHAPAPTPAPAHEAAMDDTPITADQQCTLQQLVKNRIEALPEAQRTGKGLYPQVWSRFNNHFRIAKYSQLPQSRMSEAIDYLMRMELTPAIAARGMKNPSREEVQRRKLDIDDRLESLIDDTHRVLREVYFTADARIFKDEPRMTTFHRDIFLLAENFMRSAQDALRMSLKMSQY